MLTVAGKVEEIRQFAQLAGTVARVWKLGAGVTKFVEEGVDHSIDGRLPLGRGVLEQASNQVDGVGVCLTEDLVERVGLDLRELVLHVVRVHSTNLLARRRSQDLDDLDELVNARLAREERLAKHELSHDTTG